MESSREETSNKVTLLISLVDSLRINELYKYAQTRNEDPTILKAVLDRIIVEILQVQNVEDSDISADDRLLVDADVRPWMTSLSIASSKRIVQQQMQEQTEMDKLKKSNEELTEQLIKTEQVLQEAAEMHQQEKQDVLISSIIHCLTLLVVSATDVPFDQAVIVKRIMEIIQFSKNLPKNKTHEELTQLAENNHNIWLRNYWDVDDEDDLESLVDNTLSVDVETQTDQGLLSSTELLKKNECLEAENKAIKEQRDRDSNHLQSTLRDKDEQLSQMERELQGLKEKLSVSEQEKATASSDTDDNISIDTQGEEEESRDRRRIGEAAQELQASRPSSRSSNSDHDQQELDFRGGEDGGFSSEEDGDSLTMTDQEEEDDASVSTTDQHDDNQETCKHCGRPFQYHNLSQDDQITLHANNLTSGKQVWEVECEICGATTVATQGKELRATCPCFDHGCKGKKSHRSWEKKIQLKTREAIVTAWRKRMRLYVACRPSLKDIEALHECTCKVPSTL